MLNIAAIDVGSNAIRMTVREVDDSWKVKVIENNRIPVRLGQDVFTVGMLEESSMQRTADAFLRPLLPKDRQTVLKLSAILRLADGMEVSHTGRIQKVTLKTMESGWLLKLSKDQILEKWTIEKRKALFQEVFGVSLNPE